MLLQLVNDSGLLDCSVELFVLFFDSVQEKFFLALIFIFALQLMSVNERLPYNNYYVDEN